MGDVIDLTNSAEVGWGGAPSGKATIESISEFLKVGLSSPDSVAGRRLKPEREIARTIGTTPYKVRCALNKFVEAGILIRRHGSGYYIRKTLSLQGVETANAVGGDIFVKMPTQQRLAPKPDQRVLRILIWQTRRPQGKSQRAMYNGAVEEIGRQGHLCKTLRVEWPCEPLATWADRPQVREADAHVVFMDAAPAYKPLWNLHHKPCVFIWGAYFDSDYHPRVLTDMHDAISRGLSKLSEAGWDRIGLLCHAAVAEDETAAYSAWCHLNRRCPTNLIAATHGPASEIARTVKSLLRQPMPPDALYVADDTLLPATCRALLEEGMIPGENFGLVTHTNKTSALPRGFEWSRMQFDPESLGRIAALDVLEELLIGRGASVSFAHQAEWIKGKTHLRGRKT